RNRLVQRLRDVIETNFTAVRTQIDRLAEAHGLSLATLSAETPKEKLAALRGDIAAAATATVGLPYPTYLRLRLELVLEGYAGRIAESLGYPLDSYRARFVETIVRGWAKKIGLESNKADGVARQSAFLAAADLGYQERRLRFIIAAFSWWYGS